MVEDDMMEQGAGLEPTPESLAHWLEEQFRGDERFEAIEVQQDGLLEGEAVRVRFVHDDASDFFVAVLADDSLVRVGLATDREEVSDHIEEAALESAGALTEFLGQTLEDDLELEHEVQHFHDDKFYFCSDIPYQRTEDLGGQELRDEVIYYLDAYVNAMFDFLEETED